MIHLIYISSATKAFSEEELFNLLEKSRERNKKQDITGMLIYKDGAFLQVLEGEEKDVDEIYQSVLNDDRNTANYLIERIKIRERNFPNWSMGFKDLTSQNIDELDGYSELMNKELTSDEIAKCKDMAVKLILNF